MIKGKIVLVSGGARSGKSTFAEEYVRNEDKLVAYLATAQGLDEEMRERIKKHKIRRPSNWITYEEPLNLVRTIKDNYQKCNVWLLDCITLYVTNLLLKLLDNEKCSDDYVPAQELQDLILRETEGLIETVRDTGITLVAVTNEVGWGLVPPDPVSRAYRDIAGRVNQRLAFCADEVYLVTMGIPLKIKPQGENRVEL